MIKYNSKNINDWNFGTSGIVKVYRNNAVCYYKVASDAPTYDLCYAVVEDISDYQDREFEDVYDKATEKWYKLNNLNQYEEYGVYGSGRNITTYKGKLTIDDGYEYEWNGSSWTNLGEVSGSTATLPDVPFVINYNAKEYNASTKTLPKTEGQLANVDAVISGGTQTANNGYITIGSGSRAPITGYQSYFNRTSSAPTLTIISKQRTNGSDGHLFANRGSNYNWMYRPYSTQLAFHGSSSIGGTNVTTQPVIESVRVNSSRTLRFDNYTDNTSSSQSNFNYGSTNNNGTALFAGYYDSGTEWFVGDFYWIYMSQNYLTDEQVQQVINYNEGDVETEYPKYYTEQSDPLDNLTFNTLQEAETYAYNNCVYDGMKATIDGERYVFDSEDGWVYVPSRLPSGYTEVEYIENTGTSYIDTNIYINTSNFEVGYEVIGACVKWGYVHQNVAKGTWLGGDNGKAYYGRWGSSYWVDMSPYLTNDQNTIIYKQNGVTVNGTTISKNLYMGTDSISNIPLYFIAWYDFYSRGLEYAVGKVKSLYIKNNGTLVRDLVPAKRDSDNKYGMYDLVNDVFYTSPNNINFIGGDPV